MCVRWVYGSVNLKIQRVFERFYMEVTVGGVLRNLVELMSWNLEVEDRGQRYVLVRSRVRHY
jgi:hypothetical protein